MSDQSDNKLTLFDACAMSIGGMLGGGIFSVVGESSALVGYSAWICLFLAGLLGLITGISYSELTLKYDEPGGSYTFVLNLAGRRVAGSLTWFLLLGYVFTNALYSYTLGAYAASLLGLGDGARGYLGGAAVLLLAALNLIGIHEAARTQNLLVYGKILILIVLIGAGAWTMRSGAPVHTIHTATWPLLRTAALIFVAYEGFELLAFNYADIHNRRRNLPRAICISILISMLIYCAAAYVTPRVIGITASREHQATVLAYVAREPLGKAGFIAVLVAAVLSTASAINATIFASARLAKQMARHVELPMIASRWESGGVPVVFVVVLSLGAAFLQFFSNLREVISYSSLVFFFIFGIVNLCAFVACDYSLFRRILPGIGFLGCFAAAVVLIKDLYEFRPASLWVIVGVSGMVLVLRLIYLYWYNCCVAEYRDS